MRKYLISINSNQPSKDDSLTYYGTLADYEIEAIDDSEARGKAFTKFCHENPENSHNINDYTISVGASSDN